MTQPLAMRTTDYRYGIDIVDGDDAWKMFCAAADGDVKTISRLAKKDPRLVDAQFWYQFPLHLAAWQNQIEAAKRLLELGANIGHSHWWYRSWDRLLPLLQQRDFTEMASLIQTAMQERFGYAPDFEPLKKAAVERDLKVVGKLLKKRPKLIHASDARGNNLIHLATATEQRALLDMALLAGADIEHRRADGMSPVLLAIHGNQWHFWNGPKANRRWAMVGYLLGKGAKLELSSAAALGDVKACRELLDSDPGLATQLNSARQSPLMYAARSGQKETLQLLLDAGADPNVPEWLSETGAALHGASGENLLDVMEVLLEHGANPNGEVDSSSCCLGIVKYHHKGKAQKARKLLRKYGATLPVYHLSPKQLTAELKAGKVREELQHEVVSYLAAVMDADQPELVDHYVKVCGNEPVEMLTSVGGVPRSRAMLEKLIEHGLDINRPDWSGCTLLHTLAECSWAKRPVVEAYLDNGADLEALDLEHSATPLGRAAMAGQLKMVKWLIKLGADPEAPCHCPWGQPMTLADQEGHESIVAMLRNAGAS